VMRIFSIVLYTVSVDRQRNCPHLLVIAHVQRGSQRVNGTDDQRKLKMQENGSFAEFDGVIVHRSGLRL